MVTLRILIADDHPVFRLGLRNLLGGFDDLRIVGETSSGEEAVATAADLKPDVILMDVGMPGLNGIEATRRILAARPETAVLIVTMFDDDSVFDAMRAGARGYMLKGADPAEMVRAILAVAAGEAIFSSGAAERLMAFFARGGGERPFPSLTERETEVLRLIAKGFTNAAIADSLYLSAKTVRNHVSNVFTKLQVASRAEAIVRAREAGMG